MSLNDDQESERTAGASGHLIAVVISHVDAPIAEWGSLILDRDAARRVVEESRAYPALHGLAVLATCSRTDLYADVRLPEDGARELRALLQQVTGASPAVMSHMQTHQGTQAVRHLFRVAAGLDSIALGEHEILGQVRQALRLSIEARTAGPFVHRLLERALATGARVRHETQIGHGATTLGFAAAMTVTEHAMPSPDDLAVVVGAGHMARQAARHLRARGFARLAIVNRSPVHARDLARQLQADAHQLTDLPMLLSGATTVVSAIGGSEPVITRDLVAAARAGSAAPLHLVDLGSPPNIDPACADLPGVRRTDLDTLHARLVQARAGRGAHVTDAERIVEDETHRFEAWCNHRRLVPTALLLREAFLAEARVVVDREMRRGEAADRQQLQRFAEALVRRLLHRPLTHLQELARDLPTSPDDEFELPDVDQCIVEAYLADAIADDHRRP